MNDKERLKMSNIPKEEQETSITIDPSTGRATLFTCIPTMIRKAYDLTACDEVRLCNEDQYGIIIELPASWIKVTKPTKRVYTDEQKEAMRIRMAEARKKKTS